MNPAVSIAVQGLDENRAGAQELFYWPVWVAIVVVMVACVLLHYEAIRLLLAMVRRVNRYVRLLMPGVMLCLILSHLVEIAVFAAAYWFLGYRFDEHVGGLSGSYSGGFAETVYFSASVFTTLGFGDIIAHGPLRALVAAEALTGFALITWSASFTFLVMQRYFASITDPFVHGRGEAGRGIDADDTPGGRDRTQ